MLSLTHPAHGMASLLTMYPPEINVYLNQMTAFVAVLTIDAKRQKAGRLDCCCCFTSKKYLAERVGCSLLSVSIT